MFRLFIILWPLGFYQIMVCFICMYISVFLPSEEITWQELQRALAPNILSKLLQKQQEKEVTTAGTAQAN